MKAYSYVRFSHPDQEKGDSLRRQLEATRKYCQDNGLVLDESLTPDKGLSAFSAKHLSHGSLGRFLALVQAGKVPPGSVLVVENLDRLSRQEPLEALNQFSKIIHAGIRLVTLMDRQEYTRESISKSPHLLFVSLGVMIRAHEESKTKSSRVKDAWVAKRRGNKPLTAKCPGWIELVDGKFVLVPEKVKVIRRVVDMGLKGLGPLAIVGVLNREGVPTLSKRKNGTMGKTWEYRTVQNWLSSRTLLGEYQPHEMRGGKAVPIGPPVVGYYPAVIDEPTFYRLQSVLATRKKGTRGRTGRNIANIFGRILVSADDGSTMVLSQKHKENINLVPSSALKGLSKWTSFPYPVFEEKFLHWIREVDVCSIGQDTAPSRLDELEGRLATVQERITKVEARIKSSDDFDRLLTLLGELSKEEKGLKTEIETERARENRPTIETCDVERFIEEMNTATGDKRTEIRAELRSAIASIVKQIRVKLGGTPLWRVLVAEVEFHTGLKRRFSIHKKRHHDATSHSDGEIWDFDARLLSGEPIKFE